MKKRILVVDDEISIRMGIREFAEYQGYDVTGAANGREALELCRQQDFDLIIMDIMMPEMDGYEAYRRIREIKDIPALMLSAKGEEYDKLQGFEAGIDDYVVKPFSIKELMARVNVILMRHEPREEKPQGEIYEFQGLTVNISAREVFVDGVHVELRPKEYDLLFFLVRNRGIVFSRDALLEKVWGFDFMGDDRTVDAQIKMLRHVLGDYRTYIVTYRGAGYKFEAEEKAYKEREHCELVERNRKICFEEPRMYDWNFELAEKTTTIEKAKEYTANWNDMKKNHIGFLLWGPIGTGKSYIAGCIANALLNREITVKMTNFNTIIDDMFPLEDKTEYINALARYELLILDDLGTERSSEYALGIVFSVIDRRYRSGRPLIVTTNLPIKQLKEETNIEKKRIYDRILEMCVPLYVGGSSYRSDIAHEKMGKMKTFFATAESSQTENIIEQTGTKTI